MAALLGRLKPTQPRPNEAPGERRRRLNERLRAEWIAGAEEEWRKRTGRQMTTVELERVLRRYPGGRVNVPARCCVMS